MRLLLILVVLLTFACGNAQAIREANEGAELVGTITPTPLTDDIGVENIVVGDCITSTLSEGAEISSVEITVCEGGEWEYRVVSQFTIEDHKSYPAIAEFDQLARARCDRRYSTYLHPLEESWAWGDKQIDCLQGNFGLAVSDPAKLDRLVVLDSLEIDECFNDAPETDGLLVERVDCSGVWEWQVTHRFNVSVEGPYPGETYFDDIVTERCPDDYYYQPSPESWALGDRSVICHRSRQGDESEISPSTPPSTETLGSESVPSPSTPTSRENVDKGVLELAATEPLMQAIANGELKYYIEPVPVYASDGARSAVEEVSKSFSSFEPYGAKVRRVYSQEDADLSVGWVRDYGLHVLGQSIFAAHIKVGLGTHNCFDEWMAFDSDTITKILWHELGHSMGFEHSDDPNNIMYEYTMIRFEVDHDISEVIPGGWYWSFPFCGEGTYSYSFETEDPSSGFDIFVLPPDVDPEIFAQTGGQTYVNCGRENMHRYSGSCTVELGAVIYVENTSRSEAIRLSGQIVDQDIPPRPDMTWDENAFRDGANN